MVSTPLAQTYQNALTTTKARQVVTQALAAAVHTFQFAGFERDEEPSELEQQQVLKGRALLQRARLVDPAGHKDCQTLEVRAVLLLLSGADKDVLCQLFLRVNPIDSAKAIGVLDARTTVTVPVNNAELSQLQNSESLFDALLVQFDTLLVGASPTFSDELSQSGTALLTQYCEMVSP